MRSSVFVLFLFVALCATCPARAGGIVAAAPQSTTAETWALPVGPLLVGPLLAVYEAKGNQGILGCWLLDTPEGRVRITIWKQGHYTYFGRLDSPSWLNRAQGEDAFAVESNDKYPPGVYRGNQYAHDDQGLTLASPLEIVDQGGALSYRLFRLHKFEEEPVTVYTMTPCD